MQKTHIEWTNSNKLQVAHTLKSKQEAGALQQTLTFQIVIHCYLQKKKVKTNEFA